MHYLEGLTHVGTAEALEIALGTVKSRLTYGLDVLRKELARRKFRPSQYIALADGTSPATTPL